MWNHEEVCVTIKKKEEEEKEKGSWDLWPRVQRPHWMFVGRLKDAVGIERLRVNSRKRKDRAGRKKKKKNAKETLQKSREWDAKEKEKNFIVIILSRFHGDVRADCAEQSKCVGV